MRAIGGPGRCLLTERGSSFGYNNLVVDFRALPVMRGHGVPVVFDATHSVQLPGGGAAGQSSGGMREFIPALASAAAAVGVDAFFMEAHEDPRSAKSDAATQLPLDQVEALLRRLLAVTQAVRSLAP